MTAKPLTMDRPIRAVLSGALLLLAGGSIARATDPDAGLPSQVAPGAGPEQVFGGDSAATLPDGTTAAPWERPATYSRTYYVDQQHPNASDTNDGTAQQPFRTISRAAEVVEAGERVLVKAGIYRE